MIEPDEKPKHIEGEDTSIPVHHPIARVSKPPIGIWTNLRLV